jgi:hypothetical protein
MNAKLDWLRANLPELQAGSEPSLDALARTHSILARGSGMLLGMTIGTYDREPLAELLPQLERMGRSACERLSMPGRAGFEQIPWSVHELCPAWLPPRPAFASDELASALRTLRDALVPAGEGGEASAVHRAPGAPSGFAARVEAPMAEAEQRRVEASLRRVLPGPLEAMYRDSNGVRVQVGDDAHVPIGPASALALDKQGLVFGGWGDGTKVFFAPRGILVRPMVPGPKRPKKGRVRQLASDLPSFLGALAEVRGYLPSLL